MFCFKTTPTSFQQILVEATYNKPYIVCLSKIRSLPSHVCSFIILFSQKPMLAGILYKIVSDESPQSF